MGVDFGQDTDGEGVYLRVFDADGTAVTGELPVNTHTTDDQQTPEIAALSGGGFVVVWESDEQDGDTVGIYFQRFDDAGVAQGIETRANVTTTGEQGDPRVTGTNDGGFVVAWEDGSSGDYEVVARRFDAAGASVSGEIPINTTTTGDQDDAVVQALSGGGFVAVWESVDQDGDANGLYGQLFDAAGAAVGGEFQVNATTTSNQQDQRVESLTDGGFIVIWESGGDQDGDQTGVYAQQFDAAGNKVNGEFQTNTTTAANQANPDVTILNDGRMVVVWDADGQDGDSDAVVGRIFTPALNENSPVGTVAAVVSQVVDPDVGDVYSYTLTDNAGGAFDIQADGSITVLDPSLLDFESGPTMSVTVRVTDPVAGFHDEVVTINLNNLAEAEHTVPGAQSVNEDDVLTFSTGNGNAVTVTDTLTGTDAPMQVTLSANDGVLTLSQTTGLTFVNGSDGTSTFTFNGTESDINAALEGMTFTPNADFNGAVSLSISTALAADLEGHYTFEGATAEDQAVGSTDDGTLRGTGASITDVGGQRGEVLDLDGSLGTDMQISGEFGQPPSITASAWVNANSAYSEVISIGGRFTIRVDDPNTSGFVRGFYHDGSTFHSVVSNVQIAGDGWHHLALSFDDAAKELTLYIDGSIAAQGTFTNSIAYAGGDTYLGSNNGSTLQLNGQIDDARFYSRALSSEEIAALATEKTSVTDNVAITVDAVNDAPEFTTDDGVIASDVTGAVDEANASSLVQARW